MALVGICLRELICSTADSGGGGMGISNSYVPAGAREGPWLLGHLQKTSLLLTRKETDVSRLCFPGAGQISPFLIPHKVSFRDLCTKCPGDE